MLMSVMPVKTLSEQWVESEYRMWRAPRALYGKVAEDLEELIDVMPSGEVLREGYIYGEIHSEKSEFLPFSFYVRPALREETSEHIKDYKVAYDCPVCQHIVIGPPLMNPQWIDVMGKTVGGSQVEVEYSCRACKKEMHKVSYDP